MIVAVVEAAVIAAVVAAVTLVMAVVAAAVVVQYVPTEMMSSIRLRYLDVILMHRLLESQLLF